MKSIHRKTACPHHTEEAHEFSSVSDVFYELRERGRLGDFFLLFSVPIVLLAIQLLPWDVRRTFSFHLIQPTVVTAYTSHFVHLNWKHILGNLGAYLLIMPTAYVLSVLTHRDRHFRVVFVLVLGICPFIISGTHLPFQSNRLVLGFSGLAMSFYGYSSLVFVGYLATRLTTGIHLDHAPLIFFSQIALIAILTVPVTPLMLGITMSSIVIIALYVINLLWSLPVTEALMTAEASRLGYVLFAVITAIVVLFFLLVGFSADTIEGQQVNQFTHFVGYASGFLLSYIILRTDCSIAHIRHCAGPNAHCDIHDSPFTRAIRRFFIR